jgi:glycosyltransferase involved in cell wall biosynthesis
MAPSPKVGMTGAGYPPQVPDARADDGEEPQRSSPFPSKGFPLPMALRVTRPTAAPVDPRDAAAAALVREDLAAYRAVFSDTAAQEDVHARYAARRSVLEAGLQGPQDETPKATAQRFATVAGVALDALEAEPREPVFLNYAGVALYELGSYAAAEALFRAAFRLSPTLPHVRENLDALVARRRTGRRPQVPAAVAAVLPGLAKRAERAGAAAQPAKGLTLSLCMIVRDEEQMLPRSLAAVRDAVDEIVIVDTGSTDRTIEIAKSFGAKVIEREWTGSFADARNASFDAATGDWVMFLDADEVLVSDDAQRLREVLGRTWREAFYLVETNFTGELGDGTAVTHNALRVFRNRPEYRFEGRIHEQIAHTLPSGQPERIEITDVRVEHYGYLGVVRDAKDKSRRNIQLLERQRDEAGEESGFLHFNLGSEYAAIGENENARASFEQAWKIMRGRPDLAAYGYIPSLVARLVRSRRLTGDREGAIALADEGLRLLPGFTDLVFEQSEAAREAGRIDVATALLERCLQMGDAPSKYSATAGRGSYLALVALANLRRHGGDAAGARELLERCLEDHPQYVGAVGPYALALLADGAGPDETLAEIEARATGLTAGARFLVGTALYEAAHAETAEGQFRAVVAAQPQNAGARVALAESLLSQRRWADAADAATAVQPGAPFAGAARRTELFARIVAGDAAAAADAAAGAATDLAPVELAGYDAWRRIAAGETAAPVPADGVPALVVAFEALLRVEEFDAVAPVLAAIEHSALPVRARRELLANVYLRRGFLESAGDEWMAAVNEGSAPDADAFVGLAQVAWGLGAYEDAIVFAREAEGIDPHHPGASGLANRMEAAALASSSV